MLTVDQARELVLSRARRLPPRPVPLDEALGAVLAADVAADVDAPPFDKALVDGYALRSTDAAAGVATYRVVEEVVAEATRRGRRRGAAPVAAPRTPLTAVDEPA